MFSPLPDFFDGIELAATPLASRVPLTGNIVQIGFDLMMSVS